MHYVNLQTFGYVNLQTFELRQSANFDYVNLHLTLSKLNNTHSHVLLATAGCAFPFLDHGKLWQRCR